jgi:hypothetical protein
MLLIIELIRGLPRIVEIASVIIWIIFFVGFVVMPFLGMLLQHLPLFSLTALRKSRRRQWLVQKTLPCSARKFQTWPVRSIN